MSLQPPVPPRPDGLHPVATPPRPDRSVGERSVATWSWWEAIGVYLLAIVIGGLATIPVFGIMGEDDLATIVATSIAAVVMTGVLLAWLQASHRGWPRAIGIPEPGRRWAEVRAGIGFGLLLYPGIVFGIGMILTLILAAVSGETVQAPEQVPQELSAVGLAITAIYAIVIAPVHEEFFFRGILFRSIRDRHGLAVGLIGSGLAFALIHYLDGPWQDTLLLMSVMFFNGIAIAWYYERRGNLIASIAAHVTFNVVGLTLILAIR